MRASSRAPGARPSWPLRTAHPETGGFRCLWPLAPSRFDYKFGHYAFDTGVIVSGLVDVHRATGDDRYLATAVRAGDWLLRDMRKPGGAFRPIYEVDTGSTPESDSEWSHCSGAYHTKVAIGLMNLFAATGTDGYRDASIAVCDFALSFQQPDGRFATFPGDGGTNCHPHAYAAEGLWVVGRLLDRTYYLDASARATQWLLDMQSPDGLIPRHWYAGQPRTPNASMCSARLCDSRRSTFPKAASPTPRRCARVSI